MTDFPSTPAASLAPARRALRAGAATARLPAVLEALILSLLAALLGRRLARSPAWHPLPSHDHPAPHQASPALRSELDHTHRGCEHPILYVIGPGPNRGMRPRARAFPHTHPSSARAPPASRAPPSVANSPSGRVANPRPLSFRQINEYAPPSPTRPVPP